MRWYSRVLVLERLIRWPTLTEAVLFDVLATMVGLGHFENVNGARHPHVISRKGLKTESASHRFHPEMVLRHDFFSAYLLVSVVLFLLGESLSLLPGPATRAQFLSQVLLSPFITKASSRVELTNSITASYDTNISPLEAYQVIRQQIPPRGNTPKRCLDVGAGAGLSTFVLYHELGYKDHLDAIDWSDMAWNDNVQSLPESVHFFAMDDESFFDGDGKDEKYDVICYNFAINPTKAASIAGSHLAPQGILLAPVNDQRDYWYKQTYFKLNDKSQVIWKSNPEIGAWSVQVGGVRMLRRELAPFVPSSRPSHASFSRGSLLLQFQPDVTSSTCTGIWCQEFNGYRRR